MKTSPSLTFDPATRALTGSEGRIVLTAGPACIVARMLATPGKLVPLAELTARLNLPATVDGEVDGVLRKHLKVVRILVAALSDGGMQLQMRRAEAAGLVTTTRASGVA